MLRATDKNWSFSSLSCFEEELSSRTSDETIEFVTGALTESSARELPKWGVE